MDVGRFFMIVPAGTEGKEVGRQSRQPLLTRGSKALKQLNVQCLL